MRNKSPLLLIVSILTMVGSFSLCVFVGGWRNALVSLLLTVVPIVFISLGAFVIYQYFWSNKFRFVFISLLVGVIFFTFTFLGMVFAGKGNQNVISDFLIALEIGGAIFVLCFAIGLFFRIISRTPKEDK